MITIHCAICGRKEKTKILFQQNFTTGELNTAIFSARRTPDRIHYRIVRCTRCTLIFSNPILPPEQISNFYRKSDFFYNEESYYLGKTYTEILKKFSPISLDKNTKLLDVGCGNGFFLKEVASIGIEDVWGVEPGTASVKKASKSLKKRIMVNIFKKGLFPKNTFDVLCCFHTLDHIPDPNLFIDNVYYVLKPGGIACFVVHDTNGLSVKLFGEKSPIFDVEHIYLFNSRSLTKLFLKHGFRNIKTFPIKNTYPLSYWLRMSPFPKLVRKAMLIILKRTGLEGIPLSIAAGNIGLIATKN